MSRCSRVTSGPISDVGSVPGPDLDLGDALGDGLDKAVADATDRHDRGDRHAPLAGGAVAGGDRRVGGHVEVRVGKHDHVILGATERLDALAVARARLVDVACDRRRADEGDRGDVRVLEEAVDGVTRSLDHREDAVGQARLLPELGEEERGRRVLLDSA